MRIELSRRFNWQARNDLTHREIKQRAILAGAVVLVLLFILTMEIKHRYMLDIFPSYDFQADNVYFSVKEKLGL